MDRQDCLPKSAFSHVLNFLVNLLQLDYELQLDLKQKLLGSFYCNILFFYLYFILFIYLLYLFFYFFIFFIYLLLFTYLFIYFKAEATRKRLL